MMRPEPFEAIVATHQGEIYRYLLRATRQASEADDLSHDLNYDAIARSLNCSVESARAHVFQALRKIRQSLNGHELPQKEPQREFEAVGMS